MCMKEKKYKCYSVKPGMQYNELTVIEEDFDKEAEYLQTHPKEYRNIYYKCMCSCGKETTVQVYQLLSGKTKSCGHLRHLTGEKSRERSLDNLTGKTFGNLEVIEFDRSEERSKQGGTFWICKCNLCGNIKSIRRDGLIHGKTDCGCQAGRRISEKNTRNLSGMTFGHLLVLHRDYSVPMQNGKHAKWICRCDLCGREESVGSDALLKDGKVRCKQCSTHSKGEDKISDILSENKISFVHDKPYLDCRYPETNGVLRFDFRINQHTDCDYIIEFDGSQHHQNMFKFTQRPLQYTMDRDNFKNSWCKEKNIPLIRIPNHRLDRLCIDDLKLDTSRYIVNN